VSTRLRSALTGLALASLAVAAAACGGGEEDSRLECAESPGSAKNVKVVVADLGNGGEALALADCTPLYVNDVDTEKRIRCTGRCASVWMPLKVAKGGTVTTQTPVPIAPITIVERPNGDQQAAINGMPLYTYSEEGEQGADGDGVTDSFGANEFSWSVVTPEEAAARAGGATGGGLGLGG
jgi:predicted lipoprotein with Yx(FWY)xxD motif